MVQYCISPVYLGSLGRTIIEMVGIRTDTGTTTKPSKNQAPDALSLLFFLLWLIASRRFQSLAPSLST